MDRPAAALALALLVLVVTATPPGAIAPARAAAPSGTVVVGSTQIDPDQVLLEIDLAADGSAAWRVEYRVRLDDDNATRAFETLRRDIEANRSRFAEGFEERMRRTVEGAENATGREMAVRDVNVTARNRTIPQPYGVITYTFTWTGFAAVNGSRLHAGDALEGLFLDAETRLILSWPGGYRAVDVQTAAHETRERAVVWDGPLDFAAGEPRLVVTTEPPDGTTTASPGGSTTTGGTEPGDGVPGERSGNPGWLLALVALALVVVLGAGGWAYRRGTIRPPGDGGSGGGDTPSEELLSNEERVLRLLEERGGRMKQQEVAGALDWTDAKTSQVVGTLREEGEVEVFRLGRENVLTLPGKEL